MTETQIRARLTRVETLARRSTIPGEREAAFAAAERLVARLAEIQIEEVVASFIKTAEINGLVDLQVQDPNQKRTPLCPGKGVWLKDGTDVPCRVVAQDELGNWCVVTESGHVRQYFANEVL